MSIDECASDVDESTTGSQGSYGIFSRIRSTAKVGSRVGDWVVVAKSS